VTRSSLAALAVGGVAGTGVGHRPGEASREGWPRANSETTGRGGSYPCGVLREGVLGRETELASATSFLDGIAERAQILVIEGDAGIGKTALYRAVVDDAAARGYVVLRCAGEETEARLSFIGLIDLIGEVVDAFAASLPPVQVATLDMALSRRRGDAGSVPDPKAAGIALRSLLVTVATQAPVLIAVDDVGWLDDSTLSALAFVARRVEDLPIGLLTTLRLPAEDFDPLGLDRAFGSDRLGRISLGPLPVDPVVRIVEGRFAGRFAQPVLRRIAAASGGNPLFALDIAGSLDPSAPPDAGEPLPVPENLHGLVVRRIASVSEPARTSLLAAAALFRPTAAVVEQASSEAGLAEAEESQLVRVERGRVVFAHPLYASAVYRGAATTRRRAMHRRLAELVTDGEERARHRALGAAGPDEAIAADLTEAAERARARGAWDSAAELMEQALRLTPEGDHDQVCRRGVAAAEYHVQSGDLCRAKTVLSGFLAGIPVGYLRSDGLRLLGEILFNNDSYADAARVLQEAASSTDDRCLSARVQLRLACVHMQLGDLVAARACTESALVWADACRRDEPRRAVLAEALALDATVRLFAGQGVDWDQVGLALEMEDRERLTPLHLRPSLLAGKLLMYTGRYAEARTLLERYVAEAMEGVGDGTDGPCLLMWAAWMEAMNGEIARATVYQREAERRTAAPGNQLNRVRVYVHGVLVNGLRGDPAAARTDAVAALDLAQAAGSVSLVPWVRTALAMLEHSLGDPAAAWAAVEPLVDAVERYGMGDPVGFGFVPEAILALAALGELDRAELLLSIWDERAHQLDRALALATGGRCRAVIAGARGDWAAADDAIAEALREHKRVDAPIELGRSLLVEGQLRRRQRQKADAGESLEAALGLFERCGAVLWAQRARDELARVGRRRAAGELSVTQTRVAELVADGKSNRQVASELFISPKTVEANLARVFRALNVRSRTELAVEWARRLVVLGQPDS
jgi:DNA-binding CsgD family transcriptional regulator/TolA-binding protein